ncbi:MAG: alkaline phosphatase family protein [Anaerolineales bacterium]|nr:alkaline phosphatase family protein [Anaerolineales bacterium]
MTKTLLVGWDAACWEYLKPLLDGNRLPTLQKLIQQGVSGTLHSTMPPWTPTAWSTIVTGKNPGKHGIFDMLRKKPGGYDFVPTNASFRMGAPFWKYLNQQGIRTGMVNVPFTYPPAPVEGFMVCGFGTPSTLSEIAFPPEVNGWLKVQYKDFKPEVDAEVLRTAPPEEIFGIEKEQQGRFVHIATHLADQYQVEVLVINLMFPDHANHKMPQLEQVQESYLHTDQDLARLLDSFQPDNVMLLSDHGSSRVKGDFWLGAWLRDQGYTVEIENSPKDRAAAFNWLLMQFFREYLGWSGVFEKVIRKITKETFFNLPQGIQKNLWARIEKNFPHARQFVLSSGKPDFKRTRVIFGSAYSGLLYFNVVGREPQGLVSPDAKQALAEEIKHKLLQIKDPDTGRPLFTNVFNSDIYFGKAVPHAPDLILDAYDAEWNIRTSKYTAHPGPAVNSYFFKKANYRDFGWHSRDGIYVFTGPAFARPEKPIEGNLLDIPATLLHLYGVPIPEDFDGQVLTDVLSSALRATPVKFQPVEEEIEGQEQAYNEEDAEKLVEHLRALGYLD